MTKAKRVTVPEFTSRKGKIPLVCLTAYTAPMARMLDEHVDMLLVGDSLGMVIYGYASTLPVTLDMMIAHGKAVAENAKHALVVVDMPFGSYQQSVRQAFKSAAKVISKTGCSAIKLEGGIEMAETVEFLVNRGIPVMGHVGLTPQSVNVLGGYRSRGGSEAEHQKIVKDAKAIAEAGAFSIVIEAVREAVAREITAKVPVPVIGIGASPYCDGQILVTEDLLGLSLRAPRFVKKYANLAEKIGEAVRTFAGEVRARRFPGEEHCTP